MIIRKSEAKEAKKDEIRYEVIEECGTIDRKEYTKKGEKIVEEQRLRYMKWNDGDPKYDLRWWQITTDGERCLKGTPITCEGLENLKKLLNEE